MKCMKCNAEIPEGQVTCPACGQEVQIVPDYNPLDDVLAAQVKGAVNETLTSTGEVRGRAGRTTGRGTGRVDGRTGRTSNYAAERTGRTGRTTGRVDGKTGRTSSQAEREQRRRQAEKKRMLAKKKRRRRLLVVFALCVIVIVIGVVCYLNSYTGQVRKGNRYLTEQNYEKAISTFQKAISKNKKKSEAYTGLSKVYIAQEDLEKAEQVFTDAIEGQPSNEELYLAAIQFYINTKQQEKVSVLLETIGDERVLKSVEDYVSDVPEFSLDETTEYDDVQELALTGTGKKIYYTLDDTEPTTSSTEYTVPLQIKEGTTVVRAISVNKKGIPSLEVKKTYTVELPIADAPAVTPSTGQYDSEQSIVVKVPEGYTAYYTFGGGLPSASSTEYTEPIAMPEGSNIFSVVLIDKDGRMSDVTKRNYERIASE